MTHTANRTIEPTSYTKMQLADIEDAAVAALATVGALAAYFPGGYGEGTGAGSLLGAVTDMVVGATGCVEGKAQAAIKCAMKTENDAVVFHARRAHGTLQTGARSFSGLHRSGGAAPLAPSARRN